MSNCKVLMENYYNNIKLENVPIMKYENEKIIEAEETILLSISMSKYLLLKVFDIILSRNNLKNTYILCMKYKNFNDIQILVSGSEKINETPEKAMIRELNEELFIKLKSCYNLMYSGFVFLKKKRILLYNLSITNCMITENNNIFDNLDNNMDVIGNKVSTLITGTKKEFHDIFLKYKEKKITNYTDGIESLYVIKLNTLIRKILNYCE
jgi:hypothetical protein